MSENVQDPGRWQRVAAAQKAWWLRRTAEQEGETLQQSNLMYGALIGIGIVMVQPFLTVAPEDRTMAGMICVLAFALSIPLLAALIMLNRQEVYRGRSARSPVAVGARALGLASGCTGIVAGFWNILPAAGILVLVAGFVAMLVHAAAFIRLERDDAKADGDPFPGEDLLESAGPSDTPEAR